MYSKNLKVKKVQSRFNNYASGIKTELLDQIITKDSNSRPYFEIKYDEILKKYLESIITLKKIDYCTICSKFVSEIYRLMPVYDTM